MSVDKHNLLCQELTPQSDSLDDDKKPYIFNAHN